jgi:hypothetical protein
MRIWEALVSQIRAFQLCVVWRETRALERMPEEHLLIESPLRLRNLKC